MMVVYNIDLNKISNTVRAIYVCLSSSFHWLLLLLRPLPHWLHHSIRLELYLTDEFLASESSRLLKETVPSLRVHDTIVASE